MPIAYHATVNLVKMASPTSPTTRQTMQFIPERMTAKSTETAASHSPPDVLLFVVHGMGHQDKSEEERGNFHNNLAQFHSLMLSTLKQQVHADVYAEAHVEIIPIEWHSSFHRQYGPRMRQITLQNVPAIRLIFNDYLSDVPYYFEPSSHVGMAQIICERLNEEYEKFTTRWPDFKGTIHVMGHSLGGCLCFDLLCHQAGCKNEVICREKQTLQKQVAVTQLNQSMATSWLQRHYPHNSYHYPILDFVPSTLFTVGSPTGAVHVQRSQDFGHHADLLAEASIRFYNIFRSMDPLGYRVEPLLHEDYSYLEPVSLSDIVGIPVSKKQRVIETTFARMPSITLPDLSGAKRSFSFAMDRAAQLVTAAKRAVGGEPMMDPSLEALLDEPLTLSTRVTEPVSETMEVESKVQVDLIETEKTFEDVLPPDIGENVGEMGEEVMPPKTRLDYVIYPSIGIVNSLFPEFLTGLRSHFGYWKDPDLMRHLLNVMIPKNQATSA
jgi:hypothetical protein